MNYRVNYLKPFGVLLEAENKSAHVAEIDIESLREMFRSEHLVVLRGFQSFKTTEELASYSEKWGEVSVWPFGKVLELIEDENPEDHIFDSSYVPLHWDGMYRKQVPEYQFFHCVKAPLPGKGGRTTFSNTVLALEHATFESKQLWSKATGNYQRKMEFYNSITVSEVITKHPFRGYPVIRYNEPHSKEKGRLINPVAMEFAGLSHEETDIFHRSLNQALYSQKNFYAHEWQVGDLVIADNFTLLHGRETFESKSPRHIQRVQVLSDPPYDNPSLESYK